jgi:methyl-accepting chemotaxis protein
LVQAVAVFKLINGAGGVGTSNLSAPAANAGSVERRSPTRAKNVSRPAFEAKAAAASASAAEERPAGGSSAKTGTDDWAAF